MDDGSAKREDARLAALQDYAILDTVPEQGFDDVVALACRLCAVPVALVSLVARDRQWFKARRGFEPCETPISQSVCVHALGRTELLVIPDLTKDARTRDNTLVTGDPFIRFYAGAPLTTAGGETIGALCVIDVAPRPDGLTAEQREGLEALARQVMALLELRRAVAGRDEALASRRADDVRNRQILNSATDYAILTLDLGGDVTGWNRGAEAIMQWTEAEMLGQPASIIFGASDRAAGIPEKEMQAAREDGRGADERWHVRKDGSRFYALGEMMPLQDDADRHVGYVKILRDRTRERLRERRLALLSQAAASLLTAEDPPAAIRPMLEEGAEAIGFDQSCTYDIAPGGTTLRLTHSVGVDKDRRALLCSPPFEIPICGIVAQTRRPLVLSNLQSSTDERFELERRFGLDAYAGFPIRRRGEVVGVISFGSCKHCAFDAESLFFFETMADLLSAAGERVAGERSLRTEQERSRLAQAAGNVGIFEVDVATQTVSVSTEFCQTFGLPFADTYPASIMEALVVAADSGLPSSHATRLDGSAAPVIDYRVRRADDGQVRWIARRAQFVRDPITGAVASMFGTVQDITGHVDRERRQQALIDLGDRLRDLGDVASVAAVAAECMARALAASRTGFGIVNAAAETIDVPADWCAPGIASVAGHHEFRSFGSFIDDLKRGETVAIADTTRDPRTGPRAGALLAIQTWAILNLPIVEEEKLVLVMFVHQAEPHLWTEDELLFVQHVADRIQAAIGRIRAEEQQRVLNQELAHRLKNTLAMVQAIATQTLRGVTEREAVDAFAGRIATLSRAHDVLMRRSWSSARMKDVAGTVLATFERTDRFDVSGPDLEIGPRAALSFSLLLHELGTNAAKYGALSVPEGRVELRWDVSGTGDDAVLDFAWKEIGGPPAREPKGRGFGSRLIRMGLNGTGGVELDYASEGFSARMNAPLSQMQHS